MERAAQAARSISLYAQALAAQSIRVDFIPDVCGGRLGMTDAPGRGGDLESDLLRLRDHYLVTTLVCLLPEFEVEAAAAARVAPEMSFVSFPISDLAVPPNMNSFKKMAEDVVRRLRAGETVVLHCLYGLGRTGMAAACVLTLCGYSVEEAILKVRATRRRTIETDAQLEFVRQFAKRHRAENTH